jgi:hypothetical protein
VKRMLTVYATMMIVLVLGTTGCLRKSSQQVGSPIDLKFKPMPVEELKFLMHDEKWRLIENRIVLNVSGVTHVLINLYQKNESEIHIVLQDKHGFYDLDFVLEGEPERLTAQAKDMNGDGVGELVLMTDRGVTYKEVKVYAYDGEKWKCILATENLIEIDLDSDGKMELVTTSMGSLPGYVWIYRWAEQRFEESDIAADLNALYAVLTTLDGKTVIEAGKANDPKYYAYSKGKLLRIK